jgi:transcriptional regulator with XRE-family HTH domain
VASSRVGESLKSARERLGWSREALAFHSGLSWAAITQIESGRRREVRLGSLLALANALHVSVDYLVGGEAVASPQLLGHSALIYRSDEDYLASAVPFLREGMARAECVLAVTANRQIGLLRDALGADAVGVEFVDSSEWYRSPSATLRGYRGYVKQRFEQGAHWIRVLGEPVWAGRTPAEISEWTRYESLINLALASLPATILCPYDERSVPAGVVADARHTHPEVTDAAGAATSPAYRDPEDYLLARA